MDSTPTTDHEWMIHSINIHGVFFERWCQSVIAGAGRWRVTKTNYPVEFPPSGSSFHSRESTLDIAAENRSHRTHVSLLVECKKSNPEFVNWVFFPRTRMADTDIFFVHQLKNSPTSGSDGGWFTSQSFDRTTSEFTITDEARETRTSYADYRKQDKTRTSNTAVTEAARQIALATQAMVLEEIRRLDQLSGDSPRPAMPYSRMLFVPAIITTARLFSCTFDPHEVDPVTGQIDYAKATLEQRPFLIYEYPLPRALQFDPETFQDAGERISPELFVRMHILVIHGEKLGEVLPDLSTRLNL